MWGECLDDIEASGDGLNEVRIVVATGHADPHSFRWTQPCSVGHGERPA
jgi:hypothetical protein